MEQDNIINHQTVIHGHQVDHGHQEAVDHKAEDDHPHIVGYGTYLLVWLALLAFTATTVAVAGIHFGGATLLIALLIAIVKSSLVLNIFMHIRFDDAVFKVFVGVALIIFAVVFLGTISDYITS